ncbi:MAG TPA: hypothetical protein VKR42_13945 [Ktedonobacteraceae bacterium]|nr:hypothetical protein [Ktedonobacteraceae bacterium]
MCNHLYLQEKLLEEHRHTMQREMAQKRLLTRSSVPHSPLGRHLVGILGTRLIAIGLRLEQVAL